MQTASPQQRIGSPFEASDFFDISVSLLNGRPKGRIEGVDFSFAIYAMWLGEKPMNTSFRRQLMGDQ